MQKKPLIMVMDGQGGRMGSLFIEKWIAAQGKGAAQLVAIGTNSAATAAMLRAGAEAGATGENPVRVNAARADYIVGPIGILGADAMYGEVTEAMAAAVGRSEALKVLMPVNNCSFTVVGVQPLSMAASAQAAVEAVVAEETRRGGLVV